MVAKSWLAVACLGLWATAASAGDEVRRVGRLGHSSRFDVVGAKSFSPDEIREALFNDVDVVAACDADAPLKALTDLLAERAAAGYQSAGFAAVTVWVAAVDDRIQATIEEGERFTAGEIELIGADDIDGDRLKNEVAPPAETGGIKRKALWRIGKPAPAQAETPNWLASKIAPLLGDQGYHRAWVHVLAISDNETKKVLLRINVADHGALSTLADVEFTGNEKNSSEALRTYLDLEPGAALTRELREQIERRLLSSGRFVSAHWDLGEVTERDGAWRPRLKLTEYEEAPPIDEPVSREEAVLLKLADWVERFEESDEQLLIDFGQGKLQIVFAPRRGFILTAQPNAKPADAKQEGFDTALVMAEETVGLYSLGQRRKLVAAPPPSPVVGEAALTLIDGGPAWDGRSRITLGAGLHTDAKRGYRRHIRIQLKLAAAAALSVMREHEAKTQWNGDSLLVEWDNRSLRVDAATGRLIEHVADAASTADGEASECPWSTRVATNPGEFERRLAVIERHSADWPNAADAGRPLSCLSEFICDEIGRFDSQSRQGYAALRKLVALGVLASFDDLLRQACQGETERFTAPRPNSSYKTFNDIPTAFRVLAPAFGIRLGNYLLPRDGWMSQLWRDGVFALADKPVQLSGMLAGHHAQERGPLCGWLTAELLHAARMDMLSKMRARQGLRRFSVADFEQDCGELVSGQGFVSQYLLRLTEALRKLDDEEIEALGKLLSRLPGFGGPQDAALQQCLAALRSSRDDAPEHAATKALDALWRAGLSDLVERRLKALAPATPAPAVDVLLNRTSPATK